MSGSRNDLDLNILKYNLSIACFKNGTGYGSFISFPQNTMKYFFHIETPLGFLTASEEDRKLIKLLWGKLTPEGCYRKTSLLAQAENEIQAYFRKELTSFSIPYYLQGTDFQKEVWNTLATVPYGSTISYQELARKSGHPKACRAVGTACAENPINLIIPCHRIINKSGATGNYRGGVGRKRQLLILENKETMLFPHSVINL